MHHSAIHPLHDLPATLGHKLTPQFRPCRRSFSKIRVGKSGSSFETSCKIWVSSKKYPSNRWIPPKKPHSFEDKFRGSVGFFFFSAFGAFLVFLQPKQGNVSHLSFLATQPCQWCFPVNSRIHIYLLAGRWRNLLQHITFKLKAPKTLKASKTGGVLSRKCPMKPQVGERGKRWGSLWINPFWNLD